MFRISKNRNVNLYLVYVFSWFTGVFLSIWTIASSPFDFAHFFQSGIAGLVGGTLFFLTERSKYIYGRMRRLRVIWIVIFRSVLYLLVIAFVSLILFLLYAFMEQGLSVADLFERDAVVNFFTSSDFLISSTVMTVFTFIVSFSVEMVRMLGPGVMIKLLSGSYHSPVEEERIFIFLDLNNSTAIAEKLGPVKFTEFKNDFFIDLADPLLDARGEVFQYVGDEVVLTWKLKSGLKDARWAEFFFKLKKVIKKRSDEYVNRYGVVPEFKAGCHCGIVFTSEVGDLKKSIIYNGDTMNTTSRIEAECRTLNKELLVSEALMSQTLLSNNFVAEKVGVVTLRGKSDEISLWTIKEKNETKN